MLLVKQLCCIPRTLGPAVNSSFPYLFLDFGPQALCSTDDKISSFSTAHAFWGHHNGKSSHQTTRGADRRKEPSLSPRKDSSCTHELWPCRHWFLPYSTAEVASDDLVYFLTDFDLKLSIDQIFFKTPQVEVNKGPIFKGLEISWNKYVNTSHNNSGRLSAPSVSM